MLFRRRLTDTRPPARPTRAAPRRRHAGQAVVWLLGTLAVSAAIVYAVFNFGQLTVGKQRTVNGADAAALAGATAQARLLNLMAYSNRAVIANEVFLIQVLSLESWTQYIQETAGNIETLLDILSLFPPTAPVVRTLRTVVDRVEDAAEEVHEALEENVTPRVIDLLENIIKTPVAAAHGALVAGGGALAVDAARSVVAANRSDFGGTRYDPGLQLAETGIVRTWTIGRNLTEWNNFTRRYSATRRRDERTDAAQILLDSRDDFTRERNGTWWNNFSLGLDGLEKHGGSRLVGFNRWETQDTLEHWHKSPCKRGMCKDYVPVGWGRANADDRGSNGDVWGLPERRRAQRNAHDDGTAHDDWTGVPALYDVADKTAANRATLGINFTIVVSRPQANDFSTSTAGIAMGSEIAGRAGSPHMPTRLAADQHSAIARARVFFERPRSGLVNDRTASSLWRPDNAKEHGSLYSPYWQARLVDLTQGEKMTLVGLMGINPIHGMQTPGGQRPR